MENENNTTPSEISEEKVDELIKKYETEINENRSETKKAFMYTAIGAIIIIVIAAVVIALQKSPETVIHDAVLKTFTDEDTSARTNFINDMLLNNQTEINAVLSLDSVSAAEDDFLSNDLKITKPSVNLKLNTDIPNNNALLNIAVNIENMIEDNPFITADDLTGEDGKTCVDISYFMKDNAVGVFDSTGNGAVFDSSYIPFTLDEIKAKLETENEALNSAVFTSLLTAFVDNSKIINSKEGYGYTIGEKTIGTNKYVLIIPEENKEALKSAIDNISETYDITAILNPIRELVDEYSSENTDISIYERDGYIRGISINTSKSLTDTESETEFSAEIIFTGENSPLDKISLSIETPLVSFTISDEIYNNEYILNLDNLTLNDASAISFSGYADITAASENFTDSINNYPESTIDASYIISDAYYKAIFAVAPTFTQIMMSYGFMD